MEKDNILYSNYKNLVAFTDRGIAISIVNEHEINLRSVDAIIKEYQRHYFDEYFKHYSAMYLAMKNGESIELDDSKLIYQYEYDEEEADNGNDNSDNTIG